MTVSSIMTEWPHTAPPTATIEEVLSLMHDQDIRHVPIVDNGELMGIISDRDLLRYGFTGRYGDSEDSMLDEPVGAVMSGHVYSVGPEAEIAELVELMVDQRVGAIPVVVDETRELLGIVSYIDVLRAASF